MDLIIYLLGIPAIMVAATIHEFTRAAVSTSLGDKLPKQEGRLTLNPINHFEPIGLILMMACGFGWGKPVNTSALYYKNRKRDTLITAIAPTVANLVFAALFLFISGILPAGNILGVFLMKISYFCCCFVIYNLIPVSPMDCVKVLSAVLPANSYFKFLQYEKAIQMGFLLILFLGLGGFINGIVSALYYGLGAIFF